MIKNLTYYCKKFSPKSKSKKVGLNVSLSSGVALNKPILLLSIIEMMSRGQIKQNQIPLSGELIATFLKLWSHLEPTRKPDIGLPFYHLTSDGFWHYQPKLGFESLIATKVKIRTPSTIRQTVEYAYLDEELFEILQNPQERIILTNVLSDSWFADQTQDIEKLLKVNAFAELQESLRSQGGKVYDPKGLKDEHTTILRNDIFRELVISAYEHRCAVCSLKIFNSLGQKIVDGAHIKPFSQFYDDRINNGLSLCKNHHWGFDRFWFTLNDNYTIIVANDLLEESPNSTPIRNFHSQPILLPAHTQYYPRQDSWHWFPN